jgi:DNA-binding XRE family transcriptional regulator
MDGFNMNYWFLAIIPILFIALCFVLIILVICSLTKYLRGNQFHNKNIQFYKNLGDAIKSNRIRCNMTQELVAERLGVSRQAVSKWENGISDPSTANLIALAKLFGIEPEKLLK